MNIISWLVVGVIAGWLAGKVVTGSGFGLIGDIVVGVVGALLGGWLAGVVFHFANAVSGFNLSTIVVAFLGAVVLLVILRAIRHVL